MPYKTIVTHSAAKRRPGFLTLGIALLLVVAVVITILELTNTTYIFHKRPAAVSASADTKGEPATSITSGRPAANGSSTSSKGSGSDLQPGDNKSDNGGPNITEPLLAPTGDFVSNHHPNLSGKPAPDVLTSVCTSTPGATCVISFTKDGVTKSLHPQTTDRGGSTYWNNWKLQDIGLTAGDWQITAKVTLNGQTKTASDSMALVVSE